MSFRVKTILIVTLLSVAPYIITVLLLGGVYRNDLRDRIQDDMHDQLQTVARQLEAQVESIANDMRFIASLDVMNDVLSGDIDKRIASVLLAKKSDLHLDGDFSLLDESGITVASSDMAATGKKYEGEVLFEVPVASTFTGSQVGRLIVDYEVSTLARLLPVSDYQVFSLTPAVTQQNEGASSDKLIVATEVPGRRDLRLQLTRDPGFAYALLDNLQQFLLVGLVIGTAIIAFIAYLIASLLVTPILTLARTAETITRTEDYSKRVSIQRSDEIGSLADAFNKMLMGMEQLIRRVQEESENKLKLVQEKNRAEMLQNLSTKLSKYLSPQVYESIFSGEKDVTLTSSRKKLTIFFSDIVNFTDTTDEMESEDLTLLLNEYLKEMTEIALQYGATIDKYIGDAIMIFFGDPRSHGIAEDARLCIEMALAMQERMVSLQESWRAQGYTRPLQIRVGIHTGYCTVGNFGTESRMDYTILGSPVNLASRIESAADPGCVFISEETFLLVKDHFVCEPTLTVTPKGFSKEVQLYRVLPVNPASSSEKIEGPGFQLSINRDELTESGRALLRTRLKDVI